MKKKVLFIYNPKAGKGKIKDYLSDIIDEFCKNKYEMVVHATQYYRDAYEKTVLYGKNVDLIVCCGGDGTLDEVVTGIIEEKISTPLGYIPCGSTNDFAKSLFMPDDMVTVARMIMKEETYHCDIGRFNERTFAYIAAFGLFTDVAYETKQDAKNSLGHLAYILEGAKRLFDIKTFHISVESEELCVEDDFVFGMVTNSRSVGGFRNITGKDVDMNDGLFEVTLIKRPQSPIALNDILSSLIMHDEKSDAIYSFKTKSIQIKAAEAISWTLDGEYGGAHTSVSIENMYQALDMFHVSTKNGIVF